MGRKRQIRGRPMASNICSVIVSDSPQFGPPQNAQSENITIGAILTGARAALRPSQIPSGDVLDAQFRLAFNRRNLNL